MEINSALADLIERNRERIGLVSLEVPLISNLNVLLNIALIKQYHLNMPRKKAEEHALRYLQKCGLEKIAHSRNPALNERERFCAMLLRASMVPDALIVIDRPFRMIPDLRDASFIYDCLACIEDSFTECTIFDYSWEEGKYRVPNHEKD